MIRRLLRTWRNEPVEMWTPDPVDVVLARLRGGSLSYGQAFRMSNGAAWQVVGRVSERRIVLQAIRPFVRNSWQPILRARLESAPPPPGGVGVSGVVSFDAGGTVSFAAGGTRLVGSLGVARTVKVVSAVWLGGAVAAFVGSVVATALGATESRGAGLFGCLFTAGMIAFFVGLTLLGEWLARPNTAYLRDWLTERLHSGMPGGLRFLRT